MFNYSLDCELGEEIYDLWREFNLENDTTDKVTTDEVTTDGK